MAAFFDVQSAIKPYRVEIGAGLVGELTKDAAVVVLCDERFGALFEKTGRPFLAAPAHEKFKSLEAAPDFIVRLRELGATRKTHLAVIGGGIIQDIGAFAATVYMRGLSWSYMPTTLLGMADSCIGGKSSINVGKFKNCRCDLPARPGIDRSKLHRWPAPPSARRRLVRGCQDLLCARRSCFHRLSCREPQREYGHRRLRTRRAKEPACQEMVHRARRV